jgi:hypothetical protein
MIATWCHMINPIIDGDRTYIGKGSKMSYIERVERVNY